MKKLKLALLGFSALAATGVAWQSKAASGRFSDEPTETALQIADKACDAYKGQESVHLRALIGIDGFLSDKVKIENNYVVDIKAKTPNKFRAHVTGNGLQSVYFDGNKVTVIDEETKNFSRSELKGNLRDFINFADAKNIPTHMLDFVDPENCRDSLKSVTDSQRLEVLMLGGEPVEHLWFENSKDNITWELWVKKIENRRVIKKVLIRSNYIDQEPQYNFLLLSEELGLQIPDEEFEFIQPQLAQPVKLLEDME